MDCHFSVWGVLAFLSLALLVSLTLNISHCMKKKQDCASANCLMHAILRLGSCTILTIPFTKGKLHLCCTCGGGQANTGEFNKAKYTCAYNLHKQKTCAYKLISPNIRDSANMHKDYEENNPSYDGYHREDYPVYGNLNQDILEEGCYEQMKSQPQRPVNQLQVESANQMCYASLDHSVKRKCRKPRKKDPSLAEDEEERSSNSMVASKVIIYLNSEQLMAKNTAKVEAIHDDPIRLMGLIHNTKGEN